MGMFRKRCPICGTSYVEGERHACSNIIPDAVPPPRIDLSRDALLVERQKTHGSFTDNARVMQALKRTMEAEAGWAGLSDRHKEALHMVVHKIGRILSGNPLTHDHWDDIAGYAKLGSEACD